MGAPHVGKHVGLVVEAGVADVTLVRPLVGVDVHVVAVRLQGVEAAWGVADGALVRLKVKQIVELRSECIQQSR